MKGDYLTNDRVTAGLWLHLTARHEFVVRLGFQFRIADDAGTLIDIVTEEEKLLFTFNSPEPLVEMFSDDELEVLTTQGLWVGDTLHSECGSRIGFASERIAMRKQLLAILAK